MSSIMLRLVRWVGMWESWGRNDPNGETFTFEPTGGCIHSKKGRENC